MALAAAAPVLLWYAFTRADSPIRALLPQVESRTVWARIAPRGEPEGVVALLAHLDANRCRLAWRAGGGRAIRLGSALTLFVGATVPALLATAALAGRPGPYLAALLGGGYALANTAVLLWELRLPPSPGANDNAASVAVVLALAERIIGTPLEHTEVWLLFTGAEESDHRGIKEALRRHPELAWARFLVLEGVGAGELSYLTREGVLVPYRPAPELLGLVAQVGRRSGVEGREMTVVCETQTLRRWGLPAVTIAGYDPEARSLPHWHTCQDAPENLSPGAMSRALDFLGALLHALDGANGTGRP
ncbi:hypothetical protein DRJ54_05445 [Candidatus Acetothermia bacterium]|nr:MAG: hypothetical protein DRJ54_05445 [Candidatus Acetothermia bacterium]